MAVGGHGGILVAVAAGLEWRAVVRGLAAPGAPEPPMAAEWDLLDFGAIWVIRTGIGKVNAAGGVMKAVTDLRIVGLTPELILSTGLCGSLPGPESLDLGESIVATASIYADEGLEMETGFVDCAGMGFGMGPWRGGTPEKGVSGGSEIPVDPRVIHWLAGDGRDARGPVATVSTCSGTDERAAVVAARTGALAEAMEGAAVAHVSARLGIPFGEWRVVSNTTGARSRQRWDLKRALATLEQGVRARLGPDRAAEDQDR